MLRPPSAAGKCRKEEPTPTLGGVVALAPNCMSRLGQICGTAASLPNEGSECPGGREGRTGPQAGDTMIALRRARGQDRPVVRQVRGGPAAAGRRGGRPASAWTREVAGLLASWIHY
eukprot:SAG31_NODE_6005_length_2217_cov_10.084986_3_plen_117_part_00